jgi:hypothetical protein
MTNAPIAGDPLAIPGGQHVLRIDPHNAGVRLLPLIERFTTMLAELPVFADTFAAI